MLGVVQKPKKKTAEYRIAAMVTAGFTNGAILAALAVEYQEMGLAFSAVQALPVIAEVRQYTETMDSQLAVAEGDTSRAIPANEIKLENLERYSWGNEAMDRLYGSTAFIHTSNDPLGRFEEGDPLILDVVGNVIYPREKGVLKPNLSAQWQEVRSGFPQSYVSVWGGAPGVGKSRIATSMGRSVSLQKRRVLMVNGEATASQYRQWLGIKLDGTYLHVINSSRVQIADLVRECQDFEPTLVIIDSLNLLAEAQGGRNDFLKAMVSLRMLAHDKTAGQPHIVMIGHLTKAGALAGPNTLEHMVDFAAHVQKDKTDSNHVIFSCPSKNRGGPTGRAVEFVHTAAGVEYVREGSLNELVKVTGRGSRR